MKKLLGAVCVAVLALVTPLANATLLVETPSPFLGSSSRPTGASFGILARVDVGSSNVAINKIGVFGDVITPLSLKWLVFTGSDGSSPVLQTSSVALDSVGGAQWFDSPLLGSPFSLLANQTYWIGVAVDGALSQFVHSYNNPGTATSGGGLTLVAGENGNVRTSFADPTLGGSSGVVQSSVRLFGPDASSVPEPSLLALMVVGLFGMGVARKSRTR